MSGFYWEEPAPVTDAAMRAIALELEVQRHRRELDAAGDRMWAAWKERQDALELWRWAKCTEEGRQYEEIARRMCAYWNRR